MKVGKDKGIKWITLSVHVFVLYKLENMFGQFSFCEKA